MNICRVKALILLFNNRKLILLICLIRVLYCGANCGCNQFKRSFGTIQKNRICFNLNFYTIIHQKPIHNMVLIRGGTYTVGTNKPIIIADGEGPEFTVKIDDFYIDQYEVSNSDFAQFIAETKYKTDAEKYGDSFVLYSLIKDEKTKNQNISAVAAVPWWLSISNANWIHPEGPGSNING